MIALSRMDSREAVDTLMSDCSEIQVIVVLFTKLEEQESLNLCS